MEGSPPTPRDREDAPREGDLTPCAGGGLRGASRHDVDWEAGLQPHAAGAPWMGRLAAAQVRLEVGWFHDPYAKAGRNIQGIRFRAAAVP